MTALRKLKNELTDSEETSDRKIDPSLYYIIHIEADAPAEYFAEEAKAILRRKGEHTPVVIYVGNNQLYLLYSCLEGGQQSHYLRGSHQLLCSKYVSYFVEQLSVPVVCRIIEFSERTKIVIYFQYQIFEHQKAAICAHSKGKITKKDLLSLTLSEAITALESRAGVKWDQVSQSERYGVFYKLIKTKTDEKFSRMTESFDLRHLDKYLDYLFG